MQFKHAQQRAGAWALIALAVSAVLPVVMQRRQITCVASRLYNF